MREVMGSLETMSMAKSRGRLSIIAGVGSSVFSWFVFVFLLLFLKSMVDRIQKYQGRI